MTASLNSLNSIVSASSASSNALQSKKSVGEGASLLATRTAAFSDWMTKSPEKGTDASSEVEDSSQLNSFRDSFGTGPVVEGSTELREAFDQFVGQTLFGQLIKGMRSTVGKDPYFNGGQAEEIFQSELDQKIVEQMSERSASQLSGPMFDLFMARRP